MIKPKGYHNQFGLIRFIFIIVNTLKMVWVLHNVTEVEGTWGIKHNVNYVQCEDLFSFVCFVL